MKLQDKIPWKLSTDSLRSWNFYLHCFDPIDELLYAHCRTGEKEYLKVALAFCEDWISNVVSDDQKAISPFVWYDMAVGMRAYRLAYAVDAGEREGLIQGRRLQRVWRALETHARYLEKDVNIAFHNNHGYYQVAGQMAMGRRFASRSGLMGRSEELGKTRLKEILARQFSREGVHREHSPDYHRMVYETLRGLIVSGLVDDPEIISEAKKIEVALSWFVYPNQHLVNFGDSDDRSVARKRKQSEEKWVSPDMRFWASGGKVGEPPRERVKVFPESGYWIVRNPGADEVKLEEYSYLACAAAFHSRTHKHADDLSFVWFDRGARILIDSGRYGYIGKTEMGSDLWKEGHWYQDPRRIYCESTRAHNSLEFNGVNLPRRGVRPYGSAITRWGESLLGVRYLEAEVRYWRSIRHARLIVFKPGEWLIVLDWFHDNKKKLHDVKQWFQFSDELSVGRDGEGFIAMLPKSSEPLRVQPLIDGVKSSRTYIGEDIPRLQGWYSPKERVVVPCYSVNFGVVQRANGVIATLFTFSDLVRPDHESSRVNVSGRKGRLRWKDEKGRHEVRFSRPLEGELEVEYDLLA